MPRKTRYTIKDVPPFRPVRYEGPNKKLDPSIAVDILTLYITCGLGYSPIRHIIGMRNDKIIEDVIRQHRLGRSMTKQEGYEDECRLRCPKSTVLNSVSIELIKLLSHKYDTYEDDYVYKLLTTATWKDDPITADYYKCECGAEITSLTDTFCPKCGRRLKMKRPKTLI